MMSNQHYNFINKMLISFFSFELFKKCFLPVFMCVSLRLCVIRGEADEEASDILTDRWRLIQLIYYPRGECHSEIGLH